MSWRGLVKSTNRCLMGDGVWSSLFVGGRHESLIEDLGAPLRDRRRAVGNLMFIWLNWRAGYISSEIMKKTGIWGPRGPFCGNSYKIAIDNQRLPGDDR